MKILKSIDQNYVELELFLKCSTDKAILVSDGIASVWIPKSQLEGDPEPYDMGMIKIIIPEWLAIEKRFI